MVFLLGLASLMPPKQENQMIVCSPLDIKCVSSSLSHCLYLSNFPPIHKYIWIWNIYITHTHTHLPVYKRKFRNKNGLPFSTKKTKAPPPMKSLPWSLPRYTLYIYIYIISSCFLFTNLPSLFLFFCQFQKIFAKKKKLRKQVTTKQSSSVVYN